MKRKNFMIKFGLTSFCLSILPLSLMILFLLVPILIFETNISTNRIIGIVSTILIIDLALLIFTIIIGYCYYIADEPVELKDDGDCIFINPNDKARKELIVDIKIRQILFLSSLYIVCKPNKILSSVTIYFYNRKEVIEFIKLNPILITYIKSDKLKKEIR